MRHTHMENITKIRPCRILERNLWHWKTWPTLVARQTGHSSLCSSLSSTSMHLKSIFIQIGTDVSQPHLHEGAGPSPSLANLSLINRSIRGRESGIESLCW